MQYHITLYKYNKICVFIIAECYDNNCCQSLILTHCPSTVATQYSNHCSLVSISFTKSSIMCIVTIRSLHYYINIYPNPYANLYMVLCRLNLSLCLSACICVSVCGRVFVCVVCVRMQTHTYIHCSSVCVCVCAHICTCIPK